MLRFRSLGFVAGILLVVGTMISCSSPTAPTGPSGPPSNGVPLPPLPGTDPGVKAPTEFPPTPPEEYVSGEGYIATIQGQVRVPAGAIKVRPIKITPGRHSLLPSFGGVLGMKVEVVASCDLPPSDDNPDGRYSIGYYLTTDAQGTPTDPWFGGGTAKFGPCETVRDDGYGLPVHMPSRPILQHVYGIAVEFISSGAGDKINIPPIVVPVDWSPRPLS